MPLNTLLILFLIILNRFSVAVFFDVPPPRLEISLSILICIDGNCEDVPIYDGISITVSPCHEDVQFPGDGTVAGFLTAIGGSAGGIGINYISNVLGIGVSTNFANDPDNTYS